MRYKTPQEAETSMCQTILETWLYPTFRQTDFFPYLHVNKHQILSNLFTDYAITGNVFYTIVWKPSTSMNTVENMPAQTVIIIITHSWVSCLVNLHFLSKATTSNYVHCSCAFCADNHLHYCCRLVSRLRIRPNILWEFSSNGPSF